MTISGGLTLDVPVVPDADTAREWARRELAEPIYHERQSLLDRIIGWFRDLISGAADAAQQFDWRIAALALLAVLLVAGGIALFVTGPVRRSRALRSSGEIFVDATLGAAEHRAAADRADARGDWTVACLERFRAIVRSLEERVILDERPGRTAHEAAVDSSAALPQLAGELRAAGRTFDEVCYGSGRATSEMAAALRSLDEEVQSARAVREPERVSA